MFILVRYGSPVGTKLSTIGMRLSDQLEWRLSTKPTFHAVMVVAFPSMHHLTEDGARNNVSKISAGTGLLNR